VRYLRAHADEYNIDSDHIGAIGFSAGAHLSMMLGVLDAEDGMEGEGGWAHQSSKVQAVVSFFGPTEFRTDFPAESSRLVSDFLGGLPEENPAAYQLASPLAHVNRGDAPMMLFQGTQDNLVLWTQATSMAEALTRARVDGRVELLVGKGHGWMGPELLRTLEEAVAFFDAYLKVEPKRIP
jgi:acetyl esterase/lipase